MEKRVEEMRAGEGYRSRKQVQTEEGGWGRGGLEVRKTNP